MRDDMRASKLRDDIQPKGLMICQAYGLDKNTCQGVLQREFAQPYKASRREAASQYFDPALASPKLARRVRPCLPKNKGMPTRGIAGNGNLLSHTRLPAGKRLRNASTPLLLRQGSQDGFVRACLKIKGCLQEASQATGICSALQGFPQGSGFAMFRPRPCFKHSFRKTGSSVPA